MTQVKPGSKPMTDFEKHLSLLDDSDDFDTPAVSDTPASSDAPAPPDVPATSDAPTTSDTPVIPVITKSYEQRRKEFFEGALGPQGSPTTMAVIAQYGRQNGKKKSPAAKKDKDEQSAQVVRNVLRTRYFFETERNEFTHEHSTAIWPSPLRFNAQNAIIGNNKLLILNGLTVLNGFFVFDIETCVELERKGQCKVKIQFRIGFEHLKNMLFLNPEHYDYAMILLVVFSETGIEKYNEFLDSTPFVSKSNYHLLDSSILFEVRSNFWGHTEYLRRFIGACSTWNKIYGSRNDKFIEFVDQKRIQSFVDKTKYLIYYQTGENNYPFIRFANKPFHENLHNYHETKVDAYGYCGDTLEVLMRDMIGFVCGSVEMSIDLLELCLKLLYRQHCNDERGIQFVSPHITTIFSSYVDNNVNNVEGYQSLKAFNTLKFLVPDLGPILQKKLVILPFFYKKCWVCVAVTNPFVPMTEPGQTDKCMKVAFIESNIATKPEKFLRYASYFLHYCKTCQKISKTLPVDQPYSVQYLEKPVVRTLISWGVFDKGVLLCQYIEQLFKDFQPDEEHGTFPDFVPVDIQQYRQKFHTDLKEYYKYQLSLKNFIY